MEYNCKRQHNYAASYTMHAEMQKDQVKVTVCTFETINPILPAFTRFKNSPE
jgi:hypothetical protein